MGEDLALELGGLNRCGLDAAGEAAQDKPGRELVGSCRVGVAEAAAAVEQLPQWQAAQLVAERLGCCDDHAA